MLGRARLPGPAAPAARPHVVTDTLTTGPVVAGKRELVPGPGHADEAAPGAFARAVGGTSFHPASACRSGPADAPGAVRDLELRGRGLGGLGVGAASIRPTLVCGNTDAPAIMIGDKAARLLRGCSGIA